MQSSRLYIDESDSLTSDSSDDDLTLLSVGSTNRIPDEVLQLVRPRSALRRHSNQLDVLSQNAHKRAAEFEQSRGEHRPTLASAGRRTTGVFR